MRAVGRVALFLGGACVLALVLGAGFFIADLGKSRDGDDLADQHVVATADAILDDLGYEREMAKAETIAAERFHSYPSEVVPVAWSGSTHTDDVATVDVRIRGEVEAQSATALFGPSNTAGSAERCYRFRLVVYEYAQRSELDCASLPSRVAPPVSQRIALPDDAETRLRDVLLETDSGELSTRTRAEFPDAGFSIEVTTTTDGESVVALGAAESRDCIVLVRGVDGGIVRVSFDQIQLEPGELGCSTDLYTAPPQ